MTKFFSLLADGLALGAVYALVALGFVVIFRATGVINFAQGGLVIFGAFLVYQAQNTWDWFGGGSTWPGFIASALFAIVCVAAIGAAFESLVLRRMIGQPIFAIILITIGLFLLVEPITTTIWHNPPGGIETPWGTQTVSVGDVNILQVNIATIVLGALVMGGFFLLFQYTKIGVGMRATAVDQEAALAQGISVRRIFALSWAIAGAVAVVAGMMLAGGAGPAPGLSVGLGLIALRAFPAIILGGLDSPAGAVVGGLTIGVAEVMAKGYIPDRFPALGAEFGDIVPYLIMLLILLVRPFGLFGTPEVREGLMARPTRTMIRTYADDLRLFPTAAKRVGIVVLIALYLLVPYLINDTWASVLSLAGVVAIGAIGLNLLTGYTGQPSLGMAAFIGLGAFVAGYYGGGRIADGVGYDLNLFVYMLIAVLAGGAVGVLIGLPALRLRGNYLVIVTLGLVFVALYVWKKWTTFTGGNEGSPMPVKADISLGFWSIDFLKPTVFGKELGSKQGLMYLAWGFVIVTALLVKNIVRTRPGRALQAVRDRDVAAEVVGVSLFRYKVSAFAISSAIASLAGVLYGLYLGYLTPDESTLGLVLSIQFLAVIVVGGIGTIYGSILGALFVGALPTLIREFVPDNWNLPILGWPIVTSDATATGFSKGALATIIYALLIIVFLVFEPRGLAGIWRRIQAYFRTWPFSY